MVNKSPNKIKNSIIQILDDYDIDGKYLNCYVKDGSEMNLTQRVRLYSIMSLKFQKQFPQHEFLAPHENYVTRWKILHNRLIVNKSPIKNKNSIIQILDDYDIDGKSLHCYVKDGSEMNLALQIRLRTIYLVDIENFLLKV